MSTERRFSCDVCGHLSEAFYLPTGKPVGWGSVTWFIEGPVTQGKPVSQPIIESLMDVCPNCMKMALAPLTNKR